VLQEPWLIIGLQVIAAETDAAARRLFTTSQQRFLRLIRNQPVELLPPVDSMDAIWNDWEQAAVESKLRAAVVGSGQTVKAELEAVIAATKADEIIAVTDLWDHAERLESVRRVSEIASKIEVNAATAIEA
jgi:alkanesulfonate monooxygenase SsuD/methylene tetrahydromethanopterin reductase-like flavin-dependent oxidoreductase (luciferase family)